MVDNSDLTTSMLLSVVKNSELFCPHIIVLFRLIYFCFPGMGRRGSWNEKRGKAFVDYSTRLGLWCKGILSFIRVLKAIVH